MMSPVRFIVAFALAISVAADGRRTPFGLMPSSCIIEVESGARITQLDHTTVLLSYPNKTSSLVHSPLACHTAITHRRKGLNSPPRAPPFWRGWPSHFWFGQGYNTQQDQVVFSLNASWTVPAYPQNTLGNGSDPISTSAPTESWWIGIQGPTVLQPVLELNGLTPGVYDAASWNCCPAGMAWHSTPLPAHPGDTIIAGMVQETAEDRAARGRLAAGYVFVTQTSVVGADGRSLTTTLTSDMGAEAGWVPTFAEVVFESYFVTSCAQFPCGSTTNLPPGYTFTTIELSVAPPLVGGTGSLDSAISAPVPVQPVPWFEFYEVDNVTSPGFPVCGGVTTASSIGDAVSIAMNCSATH
jgi:hypothetical protein